MLIPTFTICIFPTGANMIGVRANTKSCEIMARLRQAELSVWRQEVNDVFTHSKLQKQVKLSARAASRQINVTGSAETKEKT